MYQLDIDYHAREDNDVAGTARHFGRRAIAMQYFRSVFRTLCDNPLDSGTKEVRLYCTSCGEEIRRLEPRWYAGEGFTWEYLSTESAKHLATCEDSPANN